MAENPDTYRPTPKSPEEIAKLLEQLPPEKREETIAIARHTSLHIGPIPPASEMEEYAKVLKDAPDRILQMAEKEQERSIYMSKQFDAYKTRGQWFALLIVIAAFLLNAYLATIGHAALGTIISGTTLGSIIWAFIRENPKDK